MSGELITYNEQESDYDKKSRTQRIIIILAVILILIVVFLTFGWFAWKRKEEEKEKKRQRLREVEILIRELQAKKEEIERREKFIKICFRIGVAMILVWVNYGYRYYRIGAFNFEEVLDKLLNLNACILTGYSFIAFVSYGSISNFVKRMKEILALILRRKHIHSLEELEDLIKEEDTLKRELREEER